MQERGNYYMYNTRIGTAFLAVGVDELSKVLAIRARVGKTNTCKVIVFDDDVIEQKDYVCGSILLPPPSIMYSLIDNNMEAFSYAYSNYLLSPVVSEYIISLLAALCKGYDLVIYVPESITMSCYQTLSTYLYQVYGIVIYTNPEISVWNLSIQGSYLQQDIQILNQHGFDISRLFPQMNSDGTIPLDVYMGG